MKKVLKLVLTVALAVLTAISMVACVDNGGSNSSKKGVSGSVVSGNIFEIRKYYAKEGETELVISKEALNLTDNVEKIRIKSNAFASNSTLTKITVSADVFEISQGAFAKMTALESLELPFVGRYFNSDAFLTGGQAVEKAVDAERTIAHLFGEDEYDKGSQITVKYGTESKTVYVPETLSSVVINNTTAKEYNIPMYAFNGVTKLTNIELKGNIVGIGEFAFENVANINTLTLPATVKNIYKGAFKGARIQNILLDATATDVQISADAFANMSLLNYFGKAVQTIPAYTLDFAGVNLSSIGANAFNLSATKISAGANANEYSLETPTFNYSVVNFNGLLKRVFNVEI